MIENSFRQPERYNAIIKIANAVRREQIRLLIKNKHSFTPQKTQGHKHALLFNDYKMYKRLNIKDNNKRICSHLTVLTLLNAVMIFSGSLKTPKITHRFSTTLTRL
ncbi:MAG: hypothetical protein IKZ88_01585 [Neisseriaceae bacterium]|nr:hypothetical protein [Neisseriaceae bacterium]